MTIYSDVFARKEMKYRLDAGQQTVLRSVVNERLHPAEFGFSQVRSLYYDTPDHSLIEHSLDGPLYKEKLRLRVYGSPSADAQAFIEIKKKFRGIVYKRRVSMTLAAAEAYSAGVCYEYACALAPLADPGAAAQSLSSRSMQIAREIDFFRERYRNLAPSMLVVCDRSAFSDTEGDLRITFDVGIAADPCARTLDSTEGCAAIIDSGEAIMEIKNAGPLPAWLVAALGEAQAYPQSFSKYGTAYMKLLGDQAADRQAVGPVAAGVAVEAPERGFGLPAARLRRPVGAREPVACASRNNERSKTCA